MNNILGMQTGQGGFWPYANREKSAQNRLKHCRGGLLPCDECINSFAPMEQHRNGVCCIEYIRKGYYCYGGKVCSAYHIHEDAINQVVLDDQIHCREALGIHLKKTKKAPKIRALRRLILSVRIVFCRIERM